MNFWISRDKVATADRWDGQIHKLLKSHFSLNSAYQKSLKLVNALVVRKIKRWWTFGDTVYSVRMTAMMQRLRYHV